MALYLYAIVGRRPRRSAGRGLQGERLRVVPVRGFGVAVGEIDAAPPPDETALRRHDATVRRLAATADAILPVRFGTLVADDRRLIALLSPRAAELRTALALVAGREQMTLRLYGTSAPAARTPTPPRARSRARGGPGTRYLDRRARAEVRRRTVPEMAPVRPGLARLVRAERAERHDRPPLVATVYHLIDRGRSAAYRAALRRAARRAPGLALRASGPWAPWRPCARSWAGAPPGPGRRAGTPTPRTSDGPSRSSSWPWWSSCESSWSGRPCVAWTRAA
jgi:Gas vesicle synthesis protein GvpL/GvpF